MIRTELFELIANGENSGVEFKRDDVRPEQLAKEVVALANLQGGRILLGVADDGSIVGVQRPDLETWIMDTVFGRHVHPLMLPFYEEVRLDDGKRVAVISFPQQARLFSIGGMLHAEMMPVPGTSMMSLDRARLENYLRNILRDPDVPATEPDWETRLLRLGFHDHREDDCRAAFRS